MRVTILGAAFDYDNLGVGALASGTVTAVLARFPDAAISLLDYAGVPSARSHQFVLNGITKAIPTVSMRMKPFSVNNIVFVTMLALMLTVLRIGRLHGWVIRKNPILRHVDSSDVVLSIAGGDSFSDIYGFRRLLDVSLPQLLVIFLGKKLVLLPQTLGPFEGMIAKIIGRFIIGRAAVVYSRDFGSLREVETLLGKSFSKANLRFSHDLGLLLEPHPPTAVDIVGLSTIKPGQDPLIGINTSGLLFMGGYKENDAFGFKSKYVAFSRRIIEYMIIEKSARVLLVPHCLGSSPENDCTVSESLFVELKTLYPGRVGLIRGRYNSAEMKHIIGQCDFVIGARMHACIASLSQCIPTVAVAYSRKFVGVLETLEMAELLVDPRSMTIDEMLTIIGDRYEKRVEIRSALEKIIPAVRNRTLNIMCDLYDSES